jgi:hypothetical protein
LEEIWAGLLIGKRPISPLKKARLIFWKSCKRFLEKDNYPGGQAEIIGNKTANKSSWAELRKLKIIGVTNGY